LEYYLCVAMTIGEGLGPERLLRTNILCTRELQACHDPVGWAVTAAMLPFAGVVTGGK
jgi:hypothetical protein